MTSTNYFAVLPVDIVLKIIIDGKLERRDVMSMCLCNSEVYGRLKSGGERIFRRLLLRDYRVKITDSPRADYAAWLKLHVKACGQNTECQLGLGYRPVEDDDWRADNLETLTGIRPTQFPDDAYRSDPVLIPNLEGIVQVDCCDGYTAFLNTRGQVLYCGRNILAVKRNSKVPTPRMIPRLNDIVHISCGYNAIVCVDKYGQVLITRDECAPLIIPDLENIVQAACGLRFCVFLDKAGRVYVSRINFTSRILDDVEEPFIIPNLERIVRVEAGPEKMMFLNDHGQVYEYGSLPVLNPNLKGIVKISVGHDFALFLTETGTVLGCGSNEYGQLGLGRSVKRVSDPVHIPGLQDIIDIGCGFRYMICVSQTGQVYRSGAPLDMVDRKYMSVHEPTLISELEGVVRTSCYYKHVLFLVK